jgi:hypothetical protein
MFSLAEIWRLIILLNDTKIVEFAIKVYIKLQPERRLYGLSFVIHCAARSFRENSCGDES